MQFRKHPQKRENWNRVKWALIFLLSWLLSLLAGALYSSIYVHTVMVFIFHELIKLATKNDKTQVLPSNKTQITILFYVFNFYNFFSELQFKLDFRKWVFIKLITSYQYIALTAVYISIMVWFVASLKMRTLQQQFKIWIVTHLCLILSLCLKETTFLAF